MNDSRYFTGHSRSGGGLIGDSDDNREPQVSKLTRAINLRYQLLLDAWTPHVTSRWVFSLVLLFLFMTRVIVAQGWYIICYGLGIYYLNLLIGFLTPRIDPAYQATLDDMDSDHTGPALPTRVNDEFRPFVRRLPEFKFWIQATRATLISLTMSFLEIFNLPVFWPILLLYFIFLFVLTMKRQIQHMWKYGYVPWNRGKIRYNSGT